jgi:hypothetical protein
MLTYADVLTHAEVRLRMLAYVMVQCSLQQMLEKVLSYLLLWWYKSTNTDADAGEGLVPRGPATSADPQPLLTYADLC